MKILICEDEKLFAKHLGRQLERFGQVYYAISKSTAISLVGTHEFDVAFIDLNLDEELAGLDIIKRINIINRKNKFKTTTFVISCEDGDDIIDKAFSMGADHYYTKAKVRDLSNGDIVNTLKHIRFKKIEDQLGNIFCTQDSRLLADIKAAFELGVDKNININFKGPSGSGKTFAAKQFAKILDGDDAPFENLNLSELSSGVIESELFGHTKGSFTGAEFDKKGCFELANNGTLFLDEIHTIDLKVQSKLLKPLDEKIVRPVGSSSIVKLDNIRVMTGTNEDLDRLVKERLFKEDLLYRLCGAVVSFPPLRRRKDDIPLIVSKYVRGKEREVRFTKDAWDVFFEYNWPGNVRELINVLDKVYLLAKGKVNGDLVHSIIYPKGSDKSTTSLNDLPENLKDVLENEGYKQLKKEVDAIIYHHLSISKRLSPNEIQRRYGIQNVTLRRMKTLFENKELHI